MWHPQAGVHSHLPEVEAEAFGHHRSAVAIQRPARRSERLRDHGWGHLWDTTGGGGPQHRRLLGLSLAARGGAGMVAAALHQAA